MKYSWRRKIIMKKFKINSTKIYLLILVLSSNVLCIASDFGILKNINEDSTYFIEQPVLNANTNTLFSYISTNKHDLKIKHLLRNIAKDTGDNNAVMFIGSNTNNIDKYLSLIKCDLYLKSEPIIIIERKGKELECLYFYPEDIIDIHSILVKYKDYINTNNETYYITSKVEEVIFAYAKDNKIQISSSIIEIVKYLADMLFKEVKKDNKK